jgi:hypothetical protein
MITGVGMTITAAEINKMIVMEETAVTGTSN